MSSSSYHFSVWSVPAAVFLTLVSLFFGLRATASRPPLSAPGVMLVMLSMKRCVATSVSFIERSRLIETRYVESFEKTVPSTQSLCAPWKRICLPVAASMARTVLSAQPKASLLPSCDQLTP